MGLSMSAALPLPDQCCIPECADETLVQIPGAKGDPGEPCTPCDDGQNAFTTLAENFTMPAELGSQTVRRRYRWVWRQDRGGWGQCGPGPTPGTGICST